ncbi:MAG: MG2 domain-containing protein, partial [Bauldia sp.]|nr:MG2 domain-containing protein [Bauldia sp.]
AAASGAIAGRVVASADLTPSQERQRLADLDFLPQGQIDEARTLIGDLPRRYGTTGASYGALRNAGGTAYRAGQYDQAAQYFGQALAIANEDVGAWLDYAVASLARNPDGYSDRQAVATDGGAGAVNAYLRAETVPDRAESLGLLGDSLAKREYWRPAIRAYRASLAVSDVASVRETYEKAVAEHGFRVVSHDVEADSAVPQICVRFSDPLPVSQSDLADYVTVEGGEGIAVEPQASQICINGVKHGGRYIVRLRAGLPSEDGEKLEHPVELSIYIRDRAPWVGFAGNAYVLPAGPGASIPISSVNTDKAKATIYRIGDRSIVEAIRDGRFLSQLSTYSADDIADRSGEKVWEGEIGLALELNQTMTTAIPIADAVPTMKPGAYVITAAPATGNVDEWGPIATQWFVVSDLGLTTLSGNDGVHAFVRSLSDANVVGGAKLRLIAVNNDVLGETVADADGHGRFDPGLARGTGGMAPQLVVAETGNDYAFIDLTRAAFDLTDRGVDGRPAPGALDVFLTPERGIYRPGETVHLTGLVRDARANAVGDLPMTLVVERPDGVEYLRRTLPDGGLGGYSDDVALQASAMRGSWRIKLYADPKGAPVGDTSVLVEDFEPERLAFTIDTTAKVLDRVEPTEINLEARYLYGAPAAGLAAEGEVLLKPTDMLAAFRGYKFGLAEESIEATRQPLDIAGTTDEDGKAVLEATLPDLPQTTRPIEATLIIRVADTNGRAIERTIVRPVVADGSMIGVRPLFDGDVEEGATARFDAILVSPGGTQIAKAGVPWKLERIETDYQWYRSYGSWNYELITN